ncbi:MAG: hypothetical protein K940chlam7_00760 [Chlamydiae bacterium]|nr:hypothetical protein [Chlamydiota bacterium]
MVNNSKIEDFSHSLMMKMKQYLNDIQKDFERRFSTGPKLIVKYKERGTAEKFSVSYGGGVVTLEAQSLKAAVFGVEQLNIGVKSGHLGESLGERVSKFPLRPLWLTSFGRLAELPFGEKLESICRGVVQLGYNAVCLPCHEDEIEKNEFDKLEVFHDFGIQVILKLEIDQSEGECLLDHHFREKVQDFVHSLQQVSCVDYIFWEGTFTQREFQQHSEAQDLLLSDMAIREVRILEEALLEQRSLIYYLPCEDLLSAQEQAPWFSSFCDDVGKNTIVAFSAVAGDPAFDHQQPHPFWEIFRQSLDSLYTPLLPIVNIGAVKQGECLWPTLSLDLINRYLLPCNRHHFLGVLSLTPSLPKATSFLSCNLWVASQILWGQSQPERLVETWFAAYRPELNRSGFVETLKEIRQVALGISFLRYSSNEGELSKEECRAQAESLLAQLRRLQIVIENSETTRNQEDDKLTFKEYFTFFARDARRIILHFLQCNHVSVANVLNGEDMLESFWTAVNQPSGGGILAGVKPTLFEEPNKGEEGSAMRKIYEETTLNGYVETQRHRDAKG